MPSTNSNGHKIHYELVGEGPPLVLHPGMYGTGSAWTAAGYTAALRDRHTLIALDPLGMGASDAPRDSASYTLRSRADYVTAVLDDLGIERAAFWGYSLGALTAFGLAIHAPHRCARLVAGAWDPAAGFQSAVVHALGNLGLPANTDVFALHQQAAAADPAQAAVIEAGDQAAFRANFAAFSQEPAPQSDLLGVEVPMLTYCGTADPWHAPMREFANRAGRGFFSVADADHAGGWVRSTEVLPHVLPFLAAET